MKILNRPALGVRLLRHPQGHIYQGFGESKALYAASVCIDAERKVCMVGGHNGIDIAMNEGTPILASKGKVVDVKDSPNGYGKHVRILTYADPLDGAGTRYELTYGHLKNINVALGMEVTDGQQIGTMGNTGFVISGSTPYWGNAPAGKGVHLHFGVRRLWPEGPGTIVIYPTGDRGIIDSYNNGTFGNIDPMPFFNFDEEASYLSKVAYSLAIRLRDMLQAAINNLMKK